MTPVVILIAGIILMVGFLIGSIGIGGMFVVPAVTYLGGMEVHLAVATAMAAYLGSGGAGVAAFALRGTIAWRQSAAICAGAVPGALLGAFSLSYIPGLLVECLIAGLTLFSGVHALMNRAAGDHPPAGLSPVFLAVVGMFVGFGSALSGTGGPLILLPILMWLRIPMLAALGSAHLTQVTVAAFATVGNFAFGEVNIPVAVGMGVLLVIGVALGAVVAHRIPAALLRQAVAIALVFTGLLLFAVVVHRIS